MQSCPKSAACWSPAIAGDGHARAEDSPGPCPRRGRRSGRSPAGPTSGTPRTRASSGSHRPVRRLKSSVREALRDVGDVPPAARQLPDEPGVDRSRGEAAGGGLLARPGHVVEEPPELGAREIGVEQEAGLARGSRARRPRRAVARIAGAVRRSCQTIALCTGRPVSRSQSTTVSRWFVMPIAASSRADEARVLQRPASGVAGRRPDLVGVVLDPARAGVVLREFLPRGAEHCVRTRRGRSRASCWFPGRGRGCKAPTRF